MSSCRGRTSWSSRAPTEAAPRRLGLTSAAALVVANMIGAGVFTTSGLALVDVPRPEIVLLAWLVGGILAACGAVSYGALARRFPESGGEYAFLRATGHPALAFLAGWVSLLAGFTAPIAAAALGLQAYVGDAVGWSARPEWLGTGAVLAAGLMHGARVGAGAVIQNVIVGLKLALMAAFIVAGLLGVMAHGIPAPAAASVSVPAFAVTLVWISFAYSGWNAAVYVAGEVRDPQRTLPRALLLATGAVTLIYVALNAVFLYAVPVEVAAGRIDVAAVAAEALGGKPLRQLVSAVVALALFTSISSMVMAGPRVYARMTADGLLPGRRAAAAVTPRFAVLVQVGLAIVAAWSTALEQLLSYIGFTLGLSAAITVGTLVSLRRREGAVRVPIPGYPWVPGVFIAATLIISIIAAAQRPREALVGALTAASGLPVYWLLRLRRRDSRWRREAVQGTV